MIRLYCRIKHNSESICHDCSYMLVYATKRLENCPFVIEKPACNNCAVHCYKSEEREKIREIMRFSGPKMLFKHPYLAIMHLIDKRIKPSKKYISVITKLENKISG